MRFVQIVMTVFLVLSATALVASFLPYSDTRIVAWSTAITAFATVVLASITVWAVGYQTATAERVAQVQMLQSFAVRFESSALLAARSRMSSQLLDSGTFHDGDADQVLDFFESIAFYVRRGHLQYEPVENDYSLAIRVYWHRLEEYVEKMRADYADPSFYEHTQWLNDRFVQAYADESGSTDVGARITEKQARGFLVSESTLARV